MLHEIVGLADEPPAKRRWFHDDYFDLFVWQTADGDVIHFQLCYGIHTSEQALVWHRQGGFFHDGIERDESAEAIAGRFDAVASTLPKMIRQIVGARLREFGAQTREIPHRRREFRRAAWQKRLATGARKAG
ncbi:MAG TPA: hypothetical protein VKS43_16635 [Burkholderiales bacterium]|nr:hypothetical protein [Burkholderiales bacterium]